jgi:hypothetical protein
VCTSDHQCQFICSGDPDCVKAGTATRCSSGTCVQCMQNSDCVNAGDVCDSKGTCQPPCSRDTDCPAFWRCSQTGTGAYCVESGCKTDRECISATDNALAVCLANGTCNVPCASDLDCSYPGIGPGGGSSAGYAFNKCISGVCTYVGCADDKECEFAEQSNPGNVDAGGGSSPHWECDPAPKK